MPRRAVLPLLALALLPLVLAACGGTTTTVERSGSTTRTVTETDTLTIAIITAATAVISAALTAIAGHVLTVRRELEQARRAEALEADALVRASVEKVSAAVARCISVTHEASSQAPGQHPVQAAQIYEDGALEVMKVRDGALADILLSPDEALRTRAVEAIDAYGDWLRDSSEAMVNQTAQPPNEPAYEARDAYFDRARELLASSAARVPSG